MNDIVDDGHRVDTGLPKETSSCKCDSPDGDDRPAFLQSQFAHLLQAEGAVPAGLGGGCINWTDGYVVDVEGLSGQELILRVRGEAKDQSIPTEAASGLHREVILTEMDAGGTTGQCEVDSIVDDKPGVVIGTESVDCDELLQANSIGGLLLAYLEETNPAVEKELGQFDVSGASPFR